MAPGSRWKAASPWAWAKLSPRKCASRTAPYSAGTSTATSCRGSRGKQQHRQASSFQALNLPADDLGDMKCDGCKKGGIGQEGPALMKQIRRQGDWALNLPLNGDRRAEDPG